VPTVLELAGVQKPTEWKSEPIPASPGKSLVNSLTKDGTVERDSLWWFHEGNKALRVGDWKLVAAKGGEWELYDLKTDRAEQKNVAAEMPEKIREFSELWQKQTDEYTELVRKTLSEQPKAKSRP
jgi:arylsulfatase